MSDTSLWTSLRNPVFRRLWIASIVSGVCVSAHDTVATWVMNTLTPSMFLISVMSTVAALPLFLFTLPAGALADMVDRKKLLLTMNVWLAGSAACLALLGFFDLLNPFVILVSVFMMGIGFAFTAPAWSSVVPEVVSKEELASAVTLGGLQLNVCGIIGPAVGALVLSRFGATLVFAMNAVCFLVVMVAIARWQRDAKQTKLPLENFFQSLAGAVRYVRYAPGIQVVLARTVLFALFISVIPALLPVVALKEVHINSADLGLLFTSMGIGSVLGAIVLIPMARAGDRFSPDGGSPRCTVLFGSVSSCRRCLDYSCLRTLGRRSKSNAALGTRSDERYTYHACTRGHGFGRVGLGWFRGFARGEFHAHGCCRPPVLEFGAGVSTLNRLCRQLKFRSSGPSDGVPCNVASVPTGRWAGDNHLWFSY